MLNVDVHIGDKVPKMMCISLGKFGYQYTIQTKQRCNGLFKKKWGKTGQSMKTHFKICESYRYSIFSELAEKISVKQLPVYVFLDPSEPY